ncbi:23S rRNA (guanosine(2251)-2'-O)-methyltransferase RlmB [Granulicella arctica]|uniref:23S rRNA (guanosine(2251)-2'-O)-methyltransferase RlmB n=1 Tax=Granulicella arctica TaxID=940613 RepID=UPI0021E058F9|nr:23S rRNA (guanosine(2251)-2'-O)-methyltransferase RlmB [Granulicella arctica]
MEVLYGIHPVEEAIRSGARQLDHVSVARERRDEKLDRLLELCRSAGIRVTHESKDTLTKLARSEMHQGVLAVVRERKFLAIEDLMAGEKEGYRFFLALDGVEDPHNLGALLRTAEGAGVDGVIIPERRSAPITATVAKTSAGASEHVKVARVTNLVRSLEQLKQKNVWVLGLDERGSPDYMDFNFNTDCVLVLGREGAGLHDLVKKTCDHLLRIPMAGQVSSLNVSVAGAVVMYEAMRQRRQPVAPPAAPVVLKKRKGLGS